MDLNSIGRSMTLMLLVMFVTCNAEDVIQEHGASTYNVNTNPVTPEILTVFVVTADIDDQVEHVLYDIFNQLVKQDGHTFLKLPGSPLTSVRNVHELESLLETHTYITDSVDIITDINDVLDLTSSVPSELHIYLLSNDDGHIPEDANSLIERLYDTKCRVDVIMFDRPTTALSPDEPTRHRRAIDFYQMIAQQSGGSVIHTDKNNIGTVVDLLKQSLKTHQVKIKKFIYNPALPGQKFKVPIDKTITGLTVRVQSKASPVIIPDSPSTIPLSFAAGTGNGRKQLGPTVLVFEFNISKVTDYGEWTFMKLDRIEWDILVTAESEVDFTHDFLEPGPGGFGEYPIKGRPIAGMSYKLKVTVPEYSKVTSVDTALFLDGGDQTISPSPLTLLNVGGRRGKSIFYKDKVVVPNDSFLVAIQGKDKDGHLFQRLDTIMVTPISVKLDVPSFAGVKLYKTETISITFTVTNKASKEQDVDVKIEDDKSWTLDPKFLSFTLKGGENATGTFNVKGGAVVGETVTLTVTASPFIPGTTTTGQYEIRRFVVEERKKKPEDKIDPTCNITSITGQCNIGSDLCACSKHSWSMDVEVGDVGFGLREIFPTGAGSNNSFSYDNFTIGHNISMGVVKAQIGGDCCHQTATIQVVDKAGNTAQCTPNITQNFKPPDPNLCNHTTPLNITIPCNNVVKTGKCDFGTNPCDCHTKGWNLNVTFGTTGWNLNQAFTTGAGNNASLTRIGQTVALDSDCCHQQITINGMDLAGNFGQCNVTLSNFVTPNMSDCTTTTSSTSTTTTVTTTLSVTATSASSSGKTGKSTPYTATTTINTNNKATAVAGTTTKPKATAKGSGGAGTTPKPGVTGSPGSGVSSKTGGATTISGSGGSGSSGDNNDSKVMGIAAGAVAGGMTVGALLGVAAMVTMAMIFKKALSKSGKTDPAADHNYKRDKRHPDDRRRSSAWDETF